MGRVERVADVDGVAQSVSRRQRTAGQSLGERLAFEILEHEKTNVSSPRLRWVGVRSVADVIERADVWVIERRDGTRLPLEALAPLRAGGEGGAESFDGDGPVEACIAGAIDLGHPAGTNEPDDFIGPKAHAVCQGHRGASSCVSVTPNGADTWNVASTEPIRMISPSASATGEVTVFVTAKRPILAATVLEDRGIGRHDDACMTAGDRGRVKSDFDIGIAANDMFTTRQRKPPAVRFEAAPEASGRRITGISQRHRVTAERIAKAVRGAHELGSTGRVTERRANFGHEVREVGLGDEGAGPETFLQVRFRQRLRPLEHERRQQFECLRLEMNLPAGAGQLPALEIERERAEANAHCGSLDKTCTIPGNPLGHACRVVAILPARV